MYNCMKWKTSHDEKAKVCDGVILKEFTGDLNMVCVCFTCRKIC